MKNCITAKGRYNETPYKRLSSEHSKYSLIRKFGQKIWMSLEKKDYLDLLPDEITIYYCGIGHQNERTMRLYNPVLNQFHLNTNIYKENGSFWTRYKYKHNYAKLIDAENGDEWKEILFNAEYEKLEIPTEEIWDNILEG